MAWRNLLKALGIKKEEKVVREEAFARMGLYVVKDDRLEQRTELLAEFYKIMSEIDNLKLNVGDVPPEKILEDLLERLNMLNKQIDRVATPYWRALSTPQAGVIMRSWSMIHAYVTSWASTLLTWFRRIEQAEAEGREVVKPVRPKEELVQSLLEVVLVDYAPRALTLLKNSWSDVDVTPSWVGIIQPVIGAGYYGPPVPVYDTGSFAEKRIQPLEEHLGLVRKRREEGES